jgi:hypothetical protein
LNQLGRFYHFWRYVLAQGIIKEVNVPSELREVKNAISEGGSVYVLGNKWSRHRAIDDKQGESEQMYWEIVTNLEVGFITNGNNQYEMKLGNVQLNLFIFHPRFMEFFKWVFEEINRN